MLNEKLLTNKGLIKKNLSPDFFFLLKGSPEINYIKK